MKMINQSNLDLTSAKIGFSIVEQFKQKDDFDKLENVSTKALGVLIEEGLLAYFVWLESRGEREKKYAEVIRDKSLELLKNAKLTEKNNSIDAALDISSNIQKTLLARQLLERMLVYARYRAKALQKGSD